MIRKIVFLIPLLLFFSCIAKKKTTYSKERKVTVEASKEVDSKNKEVLEKNKTLDRNNSSSKKTPTDKIISTALSYSGVRYKFGGTTKKGMDCSGLLYVAFGEHDIPLPRVSYKMAEEGKRIKVSKVTKGDLLFFKTRKGSKRINHVGMVVAVEGNEIKFIHASTSRGVIVSSLREGFWNHAFVKATRVL